MGKLSRTRRCPHETHTHVVAYEGTHLGNHPVHAAFREFRGASSGHELTLAKWQALLRIDQTRGARQHVPEHFRTKGTFCWVVGSTSRRVARRLTSSGGARMSRWTTKLRTMRKAKKECALMSTEVTCVPSYCCLVCHTTDRQKTAGTIGHETESADRTRTRNILAMPTCRHGRPRGCHAVRTQTTAGDSREDKRKDQDSTNSELSRMPRRMHESDRRLNKRWYAQSCTSMTPKLSVPLWCSRTSLRENTSHGEVLALTHRHNKGLAFPNLLQRVFSGECVARPSIPRIPPRLLVCTLAATRFRNFATKMTSKFIANPPTVRTSV